MRLTPREAQVAEQLLQGKNRDDAARALKVKPSTIHSHMRDIYAKLDIPNNLNPQIVAAVHIHRLRKELGVRCQACGEME